MPNRSGASSMSGCSTTRLGLSGSPLARCRLPTCSSSLPRRPRRPNSHGERSLEGGFPQSLFEKAAFDARKRRPVEANDCKLAFDYWLGEFPQMADKTRSSIIAGVMGLMHVWNTGIVRELPSTTTTISPAILGQRKIVLVDTSVAEYGAVAGALHHRGAWKMLTRCATSYGGTHSRMMRSSSSGRMKVKMLSTASTASSSPCAARTWAAWSI